VFERLRAAINAALEAATPPPDIRDLAGQMRQAVIEMKVAVGRMREGLASTEQQLAAERRQLDDAERRGRLAQGIGDGETVEVAQRFAGKHRERVEVLTRKLEAQRAELTLAERETAEMTEQLRALERGHPAGGRDSTSGARAELDLEGELLQAQVDRAARDAAAEEQLQALKKKMGK